ncbi:MAG: TonB C-terminal domain-containing protein [Steroidobacteraceae bacterium]
MSDERTPRRILSRIAGALIGILLIVGFVLFVQAMMASKSTRPERKVQIVQIIRPPPPPPPPPDQPPPPPPEKTEEQLPNDEPEPQPDEQPAPAQPLGLDAEGSAGGDAFGLAARHGGSDLIGGTGTAPFAWYTNRIRDAIQERLAATPCTKSAKGSLSLRVLLEPDGRVKQIALSTTTGDKKVDDCIETALASITRMSDPVPPGMPEQVNLKIVARI